MRWELSLGKWQNLPIFATDSNKSIILREGISFEIAPSNTKKLFTFFDIFWTNFSSFWINKTNRITTNWCKCACSCVIFTNNRLNIIELKSDRLFLVWNLVLGDFANRFSLVNKIEIRKNKCVELFAAWILNYKVSQMTKAATLESSAKF